MPQSVQAEQRREIMGLITQVRRGTRNSDMLAICDFAEKQIVNGAADRAGAPKKAAPAPAAASVDCPVCAARRKKQAARMQRWRSKGKSPKRKAKSK